jgi:signal peptidase I
MRPRRIGKLLSTALGLIVLGALWFCFAPVPLGGSATYVVTHGTSMEPRFHTGDLAIVRPQSSYHVGEIVAYHNHELHTIVLHRIIGREGDRYVFKGDNNDFVDPERPLASQLIGALWIHVPGLGARLQSIRSPGALGALVFLGVLLLAGGVFTGRRRRRGRERRGGEHAPRPLVQLPKGHAKPPTAVLAAGVVALLPCLALALLAFTRAPSARQQVSIPYKQSGTLSYSAAAAPGPAYPDGRVATGEPLFTRVLNAVELRFSYRLHSHASKSLSSVGTLAATITSTNGWHTTLALGPPRRFRGDHAVIAGTLDLGSLQALTDSLEATTKVKGTYTIAVKPRVSTTGTLAGAPLHATLSPEARFAETEGELELEKPATAAIGQASSTSAGKSATEALSSSASGSATGAREEPQSLSLGAVSISVARARTASLVAIALVLGALVALLALLRPLRARLAPERDEPAAIRRPHDRAGRAGLAAARRRRDRRRRHGRAGAHRRALRPLDPARDDRPGRGLLGGRRERPVPLCDRRAAARGRGRGCGRAGTCPATPGSARAADRPVGHLDARPRVATRRGPAADRLRTGDGRARAADRRPGAGSPDGRRTSAGARARAGHGAGGARAPGAGRSHGTGRDHGSTRAGAGRGDADAGRAARGERGRLHGRRGVRRRTRAGGAGRRSVQQPGQPEAREHDARLRRVDRLPGLAPEGPLVARRVPLAPAEGPPADAASPPATPAAS